MNNFMAINLKNRTRLIFWKNINYQNSLGKG
jgi:hypothetical protein